MSDYSVQLAFIQFFTIMTACGVWVAVVLLRDILKALRPPVKEPPREEG